MKLETNLNFAMEEFKTKDTFWPFSNDPEWPHELWPEHRECPRDESIGIFRRAIELAQKARSSNSPLVFFGD